MQDFTIRITRADGTDPEEQEKNKLVLCMSTFCKSSGEAAQQAIEFMGDADGFAISVRPNLRPASRKDGHAAVLQPGSPEHQEGPAMKRVQGG